MSEGLRRRNLPGGNAGAAESGAVTLDTLRLFDVYAKVDVDYVQKSRSGALVTVVTALIILFLFWGELREFCATEVVDTVVVDTRINQKIAIYLNLSFPHLRCEEVSVDTVDSSGDSQVNTLSGIAKTPLAGSASSADGCRVDGQVVVNKVGGNVHVALGNAALRDGRAVHEVDAGGTAASFNTSHEIHRIAFGDQVPDLLSPLDDSRKVVRSGTFMFQYFLRLVPTVFVSAGGSEVYTHQYSVIETARNLEVRPGELSGLPGVFIVYDFTPFLMRKVEKKKPWSYIFTSTCALAGGVFSIASLVEFGLQAAMR